MLKCNTQHIEHVKQNKTEWGVQKKKKSHLGVLDGFGMGDVLKFVAYFQNTFL